MEPKPDSQGVKLVDWDGPDDPRHPYNWPKTQRMTHIALVSFITLVVNLAATLFSPAAAKLVVDFSITNSTMASLTVSIYLLGFALGPLVIAPLSELYGRLWIYHICNVVFLAFTIGCATSKNLASFLICRFLAGCAGAAPLTIGGGTIADLVPVEKRGAAMAAFGIGPLLGPVLGPIIGGLVAADLGWRWTLWIISIIGGVQTLLSFTFMRETYSPILLARIVKKMRAESGDQSLQPKGVTNDKPTTLFLRATIRPTKILFCSPIVLSLSLFNAFVFGMMFLLFTTFPTVFQLQYGFGTRVSGLSYLGLGIGMLIALFGFRILSDRILKRMKGVDVPKPEYRLPLMMWFSPLIPVGFFFYGWTAEYKVHWIVPILATSFIGSGSLFIMLPSQIYVVDAFGAHGAASALAALAVIRSIFGCFIPLAGPKLYEDLGFGWGNSVLGFITLAFTPVPFVLYKYGESLRQRFPIKL
ncbi:putative MFS transporter [Ilyonectria destructans]|nr:putative MFS transporter [Ilyonectria destructans]